MTQPKGVLKININQTYYIEAVIVAQLNYSTMTEKPPFRVNQMSSIPTVNKRLRRAGNTPA